MYKPNIQQVRFITILDGEQKVAVKLNNFYRGKAVFDIYLLNVYKTFSTGKIIYEPFF